MHHFPAADRAFQGELMRARGARRQFNVGPCHVTRLWTRSVSRQLGFCESFLLTVFLYEAHNYDSVGRQICTKTAVCFDQSNLLSLSGMRVVAVGTSGNRAVRSPNDTRPLMPCGICATGIHSLCWRTFSVIWWGAGIKHEWIKHWDIKGRLCRLTFIQRELLWWIK